jgi:hypothetical protein
VVAPLCCTGDNGRKAPPSALGTLKEVVQDHGVDMLHLRVYIQGGPPRARFLLAAVRSRSVASSPVVVVWFRQWKYSSLASTANRL